MDNKKLINTITGLRLAGFDDTEIVDSLLNIAKEIAPRQKADESEEKNSKILENPMQTPLFQSDNGLLQAIMEPIAQVTSSDDVPEVAKEFVDKLTEDLKYLPECGHLKCVKRALEESGYHVVISNPNVPIETRVSAIHVGIHESGDGILMLS